MMETIRKNSIPYLPDLKLLDLLNDHVIISIIDPLGRFVYVNENYCKLSGYSYNKLIGEAQTLLETHLHTDPFYKNLWKTIMSGYTWKGVLKSESSKGNVLCLDTTIIPVKDNGGKIEKYIAIYVDVTKSQEEYHSSKEKEQKLKAFTEGIPNIILSINKFGKILNINQGLGDLKKNEVIGSDLYTYINPNYHKKVRKAISYVFVNAKPSQYETVSFNPNDTEIHFVSQVGPVFNKQGQVASAIISAQDITELVNVKKELGLNESKYRTLFQSIDIGIIIVVDDIGNITEWNMGAQKSFGYTANEIIGNPLAKLISINNKHLNIKEIVRIVKKIKKTTHNDTVEIIGINKYGKEFPVQFALSKWRKKKRTYYCAMMLDNTNRKELETKLIDKTKDLEMFLYRSSHDLKAPLASAEGLIDLIKDEDINDTVVNLTNMLNSTIERGVAIVDNLAQVSVISEKHDEVYLIDFKQLISDNLKSFQGFKNFQKIDFKIDIINSEGIYSNIMLVNSLLHNLIQNGIKYSNMSLKKGKPFVKIDIKSTKEGVIIKVSDNGHGIANEHLDKIFDMYFRVNNVVSGTGLGLYIVKHIVDELNGNINVESQLNRGTCFEIELPNLINN